VIVDDIFPVMVCSNKETVATLLRTDVDCAQSLLRQHQQFLDVLQLRYPGCNDFILSQLGTYNELTKPHVARAFHIFNSVAVRCHFLYAGGHIPQGL
jgi:hypothetical protein